MSQRTTAEPSTIEKRSNKSFISCLKINSCLGLKVDLSEAQMKISETFSVPLSTR